MKIFKIIFAIIFTLCLSFNKSKGQASGYLGKRTYTGIQTNIAWAFTNPNLNGNNFMDKPSYSNLFSMIFINSLYVDQVISANKTIGVRALYWETLYRIEKDPYNKFIHFGEVSTMGALFHLKIFKIPYAPLGRFNKFGCGLLFSNTNIDIQNMPYPDDNINKTFNTTQAQVTYGLGRQSIYRDRFVLISGFDINLTFPGSFEDKNLFYDKRLTQKRISNAFIMNFYLSFGIIP